MRPVAEPVVVAAPRQDLLTTDAASGQPRRTTTYSGTVWLAPPPQVSSGGRIRVVSSPDVDHLDPSQPLRLFLPDSLSYGPTADAVVSATAAPIGGVDQTGTDAWLLYPLAAQLVADPSGGGTSWIGIEVRGRGRLHAVTYQVTATVDPDAVA